MSALKHKLDLKATGALSVTVLCWASIPLFLKHFTVYLDGWTMNGYRYPVAAIVHLPWILYFHRRGLVTKRLWTLAIVPAIFNLISQNLWTWAPYFIEPGLMSFLVRAAIVWSVLGSFLVFPDERRVIRSGQFLTGLLLAGLGYVAMILQGEVGRSHATTAGVIIMFTCSIFSACYGISVRRNMRGVDPRLSFAIIALYTSLGALVLMFLFGEPGRVVKLSLATNLLLVLSALIGLAIAQVFYYVAISRIGVAISSSSMLVASFLTAAASGVLYGERFSTGQWTAGIFLVGGAALLVRSQQLIVVRSSNDI